MASGAQKEAAEIDEKDGDTPRPGARSAGKEVVGHVASSLLVQAGRRGLDETKLLRGLKWTRAELGRRGTRLAWCDYAEFLERLMNEAGGPAGMEELAASTIESSWFMQSVAAHFISLRRMYTFGTCRLTRALYRNVGSRVERLADGRLLLDMNIPDSDRGSMAFMYGSVGALRAYPRLLGQPEVAVRADLRPNRGVFHISLPAKEAPTTRALNALITRLRGRRSESDWLVEDGFDLEIFDTSLAEEATQNGSRFVRASSIDGLADDLHALCSHRLGARHATLWARFPSGFELVAARGGSAGERVVYVPLMLDGREIGRVGLDAPAVEVGDGRPLLDALVPWLAGALNRLISRKHAQTDSREARLLKMAHEWQLSPRQSQVLDLLASGCSNKEIAQALGTSPRTVESQVSEILRRSGSSTRAVLIARCLGKSG